MGHIDLTESRSFTFYPENFLSTGQSTPCRRHSNNFGLNQNPLLAIRTGWTAAALDCPATGAWLVSAIFSQADDRAQYIFTWLD